MTFWFFQKQSILAQSTKERRCKVSLFSSETPEKYKLKFAFHLKKIGRQYFAQISDEEY